MTSPDLLNPTAERQPGRACRFAVGDFVVPRPEWISSPNNIPSGRVRKIAPWGKDGALYVGDDHRVFAASVFLSDPDKPAAAGRLL